MEASAAGEEPAEKADEAPADRPTPADGDDASPPDTRSPGLRPWSRLRSAIRTVATVAGRTAAAAWRQEPFAKAAQAAFWQTLSLPPLLLGLLGCLGYLGDWLGAPLVQRIRDQILHVSHTVFTRPVVDTIISPTVTDTLSHGKAEVASVGFLLSLWAGSSAISCYVDAITAAYHQESVRHDVWQRIIALLLYIAGLAVAIVVLPVLTLGPTLLLRVLPESWQGHTARTLGALSYPVTGLLLVLALTTLYKLAPPRKLPWHRGLPGAVAALLIFILASVGLHAYLGWIGSTGYTYGALATPIAFLLFAFFAGLALVTGAHLNATLQALWPAPTVRWWRRLPWLRRPRGL